MNISWGLAALVVLNARLLAGIIVGHGARPFRGDRRTLFLAAQLVHLLCACAEFVEVFVLLLEI